MKNQSLSKTICHKGFWCGQQSLLTIASADRNRDNWEVDMVGKIGKHNSKMNV